MRINLADIELDLRQASSGEVKQVIEQVGGIYVERVEAMEHVKDMLIEYSDMSEGDFELIDTESLVAQTESSQSDQQNSLSSIENEKITLDVLADLEDIDSNDELFSELPESSQEYNASEIHDNESTSHDNSSVLPILNSVLNTIENDQVYDI
jgi:large repetitive protein